MCLRWRTVAHMMDVFADGTYGVALLPSYALDASTPDITYHRVSSTEYRISVSNASGPFFIKFSEGPNKYWTIETENGDSTTWFRTDYLANGFLVNGTGDFEMTMKFTKQGDYETVPEHLPRGNSGEHGGDRRHLRRH